ncbi:MAG: FixH family protein [Candidatus Rokubacteria bacterium]|nr:FixH family protein [Candidatus Rokubacteria bacterium]
MVGGAVARGALLGAALAAIPAELPAGTLKTDVGGVGVELSSEPETPGTRQATTYVVRLTQADGEPLTGAKVTLRGRMADGMTVIAPLPPAAEPGIYRGRVLFTMGGQWDLRLRVAGKGTPFEVPLTEHIGR